MPAPPEDRYYSPHNKVLSNRGYWWTTLYLVSMWIFVFSSFLQAYSQVDAQPLTWTCNMLFKHNSRSFPLPHPQTIQPVIPLSIVIYTCTCIRYMYIYNVCRVSFNNISVSFLSFLSLNEGTIQYSQCLYSVPVQNDKWSKSHLNLCTAFGVFIWNILENSVQPYCWKLVFLF